MTKKILLQIDTDPQPSSFDSIVAIDSGVDELLTYSETSVLEVESLIHGAMFTRGIEKLNCSAAFFGGSDVEQTIQLFDRAKKSFFGPFQVSLMADPNGSNTTAVAAVLSAEKHISVDGRTVTVLAGTGPVGQRIAELMVAQGATVQIGSRRLERAQQVCTAISDRTGNGKLIPVEVGTSRQAVDICAESIAVFGAGAAGIELLHDSWMNENNEIRVAIDVNAVPPAGLAGVDVMDKATERGSATCYGAIGVGGLKMKIHRRSIECLFESNNAVLDLAAIYQIGKELTV